MDTDNTNNELQWVIGEAGPFKQTNVAENNGFKYWYYRFGGSDMYELTIEFGGCSVCKMHGIFANESMARMIANKHNSMVSKNIKPQNSEFNCPPIAQQNQKKMLEALDTQRVEGVDTRAAAPITKETLQKALETIKNAKAKEEDKGDDGCGRYECKAGRPFNDNVGKFWYHPKAVEIGDSDETITFWCPICGKHFIEELPQ